MHVVSSPPAAAHPRCEAKSLREGPRRRHSSPRTVQRLCGLVALATATAFAVPVGELIAASRRPAYVAFARQSAMYLAHVTFGLSYSEVGRAFGRDRTTAAYACKLVEDQRDDPAVDAVLGSLESVCDALRRKLSVPARSAVRP